ncbi:MAG: HD domain-containing protein [Spirochaetes bacterium]|nr:HD domain-containing protein [Spirochaetota bacterium]
MITKGLIEKLFQAASIQRWNDHVRPTELTEIDKQAHKMIIAYTIAKFQEEENPGCVNWQLLIEGGIFELLHRVIVTDIKPPIFHKIIKEKGNELNDWVFGQLEDDISCVKGNFNETFKRYFNDSKFAAFEKKILNAAHYLATNWEFQIIYQSNKFLYDIEKTKNEIESQIEHHIDLTGVQKILLHRNISGFINLCGQLRFQQRWAQTPRIPKTSVLGHMLIVALLSYFCSRELGACQKRMYNNFFASLFHDLPEVLTRDIVSPVKRSVKGLEEIIKEYEIIEANNRIFPLIPHTWHNEMRYYIFDEFENKIYYNDTIRKGLSFDELNTQFNDDRFNPLDGQMLKACDDFAAFLEASFSIKYGIKPEGLESAKRNIYQKYRQKHLTIGDMEFIVLFDYFN